MKKKSVKELRRFGITLAIAFGVFGGIFLWRGRLLGPYFLLASGFFFVIGLLFPIILWPIEWAWMKIGHALGFVMTRVLLAATFYVAIAPVGILLKLLNKDLLKLKPDKKAASFWIEVDSTGPTSRADKPY